MGCCIFLISTKGKLHDCPVGGGHVLGGRGTSVLRAGQPPECTERPPRSGVRHFPRDWPLLCVRVANCLAADSRDSQPSLCRRLAVRARVMGSSCRGMDPEEEWLSANGGTGAWDKLLCERSSCADLYLHALS